MFFFFQFNEIQFHKGWHIKWVAILMGTIFSNLHVGYQWTSAWVSYNISKCWLSLKLLKLLHHKTIQLVGLVSAGRFCLTYKVSINIELLDINCSTKFGSCRAFACRPTERKIRGESELCDT